MLHFLRSAQDKPYLYSCFALLRIAAFPLACHSAFTPAKPLQKPLNNPLLGASCRDFVTLFGGFCTEPKSYLLILKDLLALFRNLYFFYLARLPPAWVFTVAL